MKQITTYDKLIGKTIDRHSYDDNQFFLFFTDNTFCIFKGTYFGECSVDLEEDIYNTEPQLWNYKDLFKLGFISEDEFNSWEKLKNGKEAKALELRERTLLKHLKSKYEDE